MQQLGIYLRELDPERATPLGLCNLQPLSESRCAAGARDEALNKPDFIVCGIAGSAGTHDTRSPFRMRTTSAPLPLPAPAITAPIFSAASFSGSSPIWL